MFTTGWKRTPPSFPAVVSVTCLLGLCHTYVVKYLLGGRCVQGPFTHMISSALPHNPMTAHCVIPVLQDEESKTDKGE